MFSVRGAHIFVFTNENAENSSKIEVKSNRVTIGAHPLNNIRLHTLNAERLHCKIFADSASSVTIENYSQRNPISVNGVIVERTAKLHDNDRFEVAGTIFLWNFDPVHIRAVSKQSKRPIMQRRRKTITLKRIRSTGDITKQSFVTVPRAVGLMLNEYRKRRTIHSTMSEQFHKASSRPAGLCDDSVDSTNHTNALDDLSTQALLNVTPSDLTSCITPLIEKENIVPGRIKDRNISSSKRTPHISAAKKRHLACHTPVSPLIDLTTPPAKSRATTIARKALSAKAVQSPRLPDVVNIVTPSPKKINRTPSSSKAVASTPKTTLLRSAIKNSRTHEMEAKTLSVSSISIKKTPHTKMNTSSTNTPKLTPVASKSSSVKIRKHLISTLSEKKSGTLLKTDSPVPIINAGRFSKHSTPTVGKGHRTPKGGISSVTPKIQHPVPYNIPVVVIESNANNENDVAADCVSIEPIVDVQSVIKKPNRTTQIRSAKYSDITPHESFVDGLMPLALPPEESVQALQTESIPAPANMFQDELKSINYKTTNFNVNRNSCSSIVATVLTGLPETRKTMNEFSSDLCGSPLRRLVKPHLQLNEDSTKDVESLANDVDEDALLTSSALEPPVQTDVISTPELRHSWRHTRKCIGSAFTSLNTSRPQLDLTAEIDESLVFIEDEETPLESNELYNMECSKASFTVEQHIDLHHPTVNNLEAAQTVPEAFTETDSILIADVLPERSYEEQTAADSYDKEKYQQTAEQMEAVPESTAELVLESMTDIHCGLEQEDVNMDPLEKVPESASEVVLESVTDIRCGSGQEVEGNMILTETDPESAAEAVLKSVTDIHYASGQEDEDNLDLSETDPESAPEPVLQSVSDVRTERLYEEQAAAECSDKEKDEHTAEQMETVPESPAEPVLESMTNIHCASGQEDEDNLDLSETDPESAAEAVLESVTDIHYASGQEDEDNLDLSETDPESAAEHVLESMTDIHCGSEQEDVNMDPLEKVPESASDAVLESVTDIRCGSGQEEEDILNLTETDPEPTQETVKNIHSVSGQEDEDNLDLSETDPESAAKAVLESYTDIHCASGQEDEDNLDLSETDPESAPEPVLESVTDIRCGSEQEEEDNLDLSETDPESAPEPVLQSVSDVRTERLYEEQAAADCSDKEKDEHTAEQMETVPESPAEPVLESMTNIHCASGQEDEDNLDLSETDSESAAKAVLESYTDIHYASGQEDEENLDLSETAPESAPEPVLQSVSDVRTERLYEEQAAADCSDKEKDEHTAEQMETVPESPAEPVLESMTNIHCASGQEDEDNLDLSETDPESAPEAVLESVTDIHFGSGQEDEDNLDLSETDPESAAEAVLESVTDIRCGSGQEDGDNMILTETDPESAAEAVLESVMDIHYAPGQEDDDNLDLSETDPESAAEPVLESMRDIHCGSEQEDVNMDPLEKVPESASEAVLESVTDIRCGSGQEEEDILNLTETDPKSAQEPVLQSVSDVRTERLYEEQATTDCSNEEKDEATAEQMEVAVPETPLKSGSQSEPDVHSGSEQGKEDNLDSADPVPESASEPGLESVTDIRCGSRQEEVDNLNQPETNPESAPEPVTDIPSGSGQEEENLNLSEAERSHEEQATADLSEQPKEEKTLDPMEVEPEAPLNQSLDSTTGQLSERSLLEKASSPGADLKTSLENESGKGNNSAAYIITKDTPKQSPNRHGQDEALQKNATEITEMKESTPIVSKRRLYTKNTRISEVIPDHTIEPLCPVSDEEYLQMMKSLTQKRNQPKNERVDRGNTETRKNLPRRACREKIVNLSEHFLAGDSPAPKFVKPKLVVQDAQNETSESLDKVIAPEEETIITQNPSEVKSKPTAVKKGRSRKNVAEIRADTSDSNVKDKGTPSAIKRGRMKKNVPKAEADTDGESVISQKITNEDSPPEANNSARIELVATKSNDKEKSTPAAIKRSWARKNVPKVEADTDGESAIPQKVTKEDSLPEANNSNMDTSRTLDAIKNNVKEKSTPAAIRRGRARKNVPKVEADTDGESAIPQKTTKEDSLPEANNSNMDTSRTLDAIKNNVKEQGTPAAIRRGRARKNVPKIEADTDGESAIPQKTTKEDSLPEANNSNMDTSRTLDAIKNNVKEQGTSAAIRRGRARKNVPKVEADTDGESAIPQDLANEANNPELAENNVQEQETPVVARRGRQRKNVAQVESVISQNATNEDSLLKANNSNTEQMLVMEKGTPSVIRRGRARKKVPEAEIDTVVEPAIPQDLANEANNPELLENNVQEQETPVVARRGRQRKNVAQVESVISQNATNEDSLLKANNSNTEQMLVVEKGTPSVIRRGRARKKVPEAEIDTDVESVTTETAANESLPKVTKSNSNLGKIQQAEVENNTEEPEKPAATRRGRVRKDISEVEPSRQPVKKGRGHKATETVEENDPVEEKSNENEGKEENIEKPLKKQRRRKIEVHTEEEELNNADKNEPPTEPKRSRRVVQQEKDIENISNKITTAKTNSKKTVTFKAAGESVSDDSTVVKNATENIDVARPRRTRAKRN